MNDNILRGFCQKCSGSIHLKENTVKYLNEKEYGWTPFHNFLKKKHKIEPVWFLSAQQMRIVYESKEYEEYYEKNLNL